VLCAVPFCLLLLLFFPFGFLIILLTDGHIIPAGVKIVLSPWIVHHDESVYPKPEKWNPNHFDPSKMTTRHPYAFVPFGVGSRTCIGRLLYKAIPVDIIPHLSSLLSSTGWQENALPALIHIKDSF